MVKSRDRRGLPQLYACEQERAYRTTAWSSCAFFRSSWKPLHPHTEGWWDISQERAGVLQWMSRGTLGRTGWDTVGVELPLWPSCENSRDAWSSGLGWIGCWLRVCGQDLWEVFWRVSAAALSWKK